MSLTNLLFFLQLTVFDVFVDGAGIGKSGNAGAKDKRESAHGGVFAPGGVASMIWGSRERNPFYDEYGYGKFPPKEADDFVEMNKSPPPEAVEKGSYWKSNICFMSIEIGTCKQDVTRWAYDMASSKCTTFKYTGCGGNSNNFSSEKRCNELCNFLPVAGCERYNKKRRMIGTVLEGIPEDC